MPQQRDFLYFESPQIPLKEVPFGDLQANIIDPTTGKPYKGIVLEGVFAQFSNEPNNNKRIYDVDEYLRLLDTFKQQVLSKKGVYGELEHPDRYSVDYKCISHKIIDVWYIPETMTVMGRVLLLNTPNGKIAQEVVKSGGQLAISARAAGSEIKQSDGTFRAVTKLLTTYDLVYHPGFSTAVLEFKTLNESQQFLQQAGENKKGYGFKVYSNQLNKISNIYTSYITLNESQESLLNRRSKCFQEYLKDKLNESEQESKQQQTKQQNILEKGDSPDQKQKQNKLQKAVDKELDTVKSQQKQQEKTAKLQQAMFFQQVDAHQKKLVDGYTISDADKAYFDDAAGFINSNSVGFGNESVTASN